MGFPSEKELKSMRKKLAKVEPSRLLPKNASRVDQLKFKLCQKFVVYLREHEISKLELAKKLKVNPSRISEIVKYRIDLFTIDKLVDLAERLEMDLHIDVA